MTIERSEPARSATEFEFANRAGVKLAITEGLRADG